MHCKGILVGVRQHIIVAFFTSICNMIESQVSCYIGKVKTWIYSMFCYVGCAQEAYFWCSYFNFLRKHIQEELQDTKHIHLLCSTSKGFRSQKAQWNWDVLVQNWSLSMLFTICELLILNGSNVWKFES